MPTILRFFPNAVQRQVLSFFYQIFCFFFLIKNIFTYASVMFLQKFVSFFFVVIYLITRCFRQRIGREVNWVQYEVFFVGKFRSLSPYHTITAVGNTCYAIFLKCHFKHHASISMFGRHIRNEIPQRIQNNILLSGYTVLAKFNRLHHMWMTAYDMIHPLCQKPIGQFYLIARG